MSELVCVWCVFGHIPLFVCVVFICSLHSVSICVCACVSVCVWESVLRTQLITCRKRWGSLVGLVWSRETYESTAYVLNSLSSSTLSDPEQHAHTIFKSSILIIKHHDTSTEEWTTRIEQRERKRERERERGREIWTRECDCKPWRKKKIWPAVNNCLRNLQREVLQSEGGKEKLQTLKKS